MKRDKNTGNKDSHSENGILGTLTLYDAVCSGAGPPFCFGPRSKKNNLEIDWLSKVTEKKKKTNKEKEDAARLVRSNFRFGFVGAVTVYKK